MRLQWCDPLGSRFSRTPFGQLPVATVQSASVVQIVLPSPVQRESVPSTVCRHKSSALAPIGFGPL
jgi:hypothetical protein